MQTYHLTVQENYTAVPGDCKEIDNALLVYYTKNILTCPQKSVKAETKANILTQNI